MGRLVPAKEAAKELKISYAKLLRLIDRGEIETTEDSLDRRVKLVDIDVVKSVFRIRA